jgi:hypothetical protein
MYVYTVDLNTFHFHARVQQIKPLLWHGFSGRRKNYGAKSVLENGI